MLVSSMLTFAWCWVSQHHLSTCACLVLVCETSHWRGTDILRWDGREAPASIIFSRGKNAYESTVYHWAELNVDIERLTCLINTLQYIEQKPPHGYDCTPDHDMAVSSTTFLGGRGDYMTMFTAFAKFKDRKVY